MKNVRVSVDEKTHRKARQRVAEDERSSSAVVREALQSYSAPATGSDHVARMNALWAELDARGEGITVGGRMSRSEMYDTILAERGTPRE